MLARVGHVGMGQLADLSVLCRIILASVLLATEVNIYVSSYHTLVVQCSRFTQFGLEYFKKIGWTVLIKIILQHL